MSHCTVEQNGTDFLLLKKQTSSNKLNMNKGQRWAVPVPNYFCTELLKRITFSVPVPPVLFKICTGAGTELL